METCSFEFSENRGTRQEPAAVHSSEPREVQKNSNQVELQRIIHSIKTRNRHSWVQPRPVLKKPPGRVRVSYDWAKVQEVKQPPPRTQNLLRIGSKSIQCMEDLQRAQQFVQFLGSLPPHSSVVSPRSLEYPQPSEWSSVYAPVFTHSNHFESMCNMHSVQNASTVHASQESMHALQNPHLQMIPNTPSPQESRFLRELQCTPATTQVRNEEQAAHAVQPMQLSQALSALESPHTREAAFQPVQCENSPPRLPRKKYTARRTGLSSDELPGAY